MDSLKVERWQTDLDKFQERARELGAKVLVETAEGDDELQLRKAESCWIPGFWFSSIVTFRTSKTIQKSLPKEKWPRWI